MYVGLTWGAQDKMPGCSQRATGTQGDQSLELKFCHKSVFDCDQQWKVKTLTPVILDKQTFTL